MEQTLQQNINKQTALTLELQGKKEQHANIDFKMVAFSLGGKDYAIDILKVKEIAKADRFTYVPNTSPFVTGVYNLRGEIIPIIDLRLFFNLEKEQEDGDRRKDQEYENMIIVTIGDQKYGTIVDKIERVAGIQSSSIQPPHPLFGDINIKYIYGIVEHEGRMYILLDVSRIFGVEAEPIQEEKEIRIVTNTKQETVVKAEPPRARMGEILSGMASNPPAARIQEPPKKALEPITKPMISTPPVTQPQTVVESEPQAPVVAKVEPIVSRSQPAAVQPAEMDEFEYKFVIETLKKFQNFHVTEINDAWIRRRYKDWKSQKGEGAPLNDVNDAIEFLKPFYSKFNGQFWSQDYADALFALLPNNEAKQINVWNPGCGAGYEAYSLACLLHKRYPNSKIKVYAHDTDLLLISSAPLLRISDDLENSWYAPYLTKTVSGETVFSPEIRDSIMFEYHDCTHMNVVPVADLVFSRDFLSYVSEEKVEEVVLDFYEKLKDAGLIVLGDNELLTDSSKWLEKMCDNMVSYNKL